MKLIIGDNTLVIGDDALKASVEKIESVNFRGLPLWDIDFFREFKSRIENQKYQRIYLSCSHPLAGFERSKDILMLKEDEFISFKGEEKGFYLKPSLGRLDRNTFEKLIESYFLKLKWLLSLDQMGRVRLLDIKIIFHELVRGKKESPLHDRLVAEFDCLDLSNILEREDFTRYGCIRPTRVDTINKILSIL